MKTEKHKIKVSQRGACGSVSLPADLVEKLGVSGWEGLELIKESDKLFKLQEGTKNKLQSRTMSGKKYYYFYTTKFKKGEDLTLYVEAGTKCILIKRGK